MTWVFLHTLLGVCKFLLPVFLTFLITLRYWPFSSVKCTYWEYCLWRSKCSQVTIKVPKRPPTSSPLVIWSSHTVRKSKLKFPHAGCHISCVKAVSSTVLSCEHISPNWKSIGIPYNSTVVLSRRSQKVTKKRALLVMIFLPIPLHALACSVSCL